MFATTRRDAGEEGCPGEKYGNRGTWIRCIQPGVHAQPEKARYDRTGDGRLSCPAGTLGSDFDVGGGVVRRIEVSTGIERGPIDVGVGCAEMLSVTEVEQHGGIETELFGDRDFDVKTPRSPCRRALDRKAPPVRPPGTANECAEGEAVAQTLRESKLEVVSVAEFQNTSPSTARREACEHNVVGQSVVSSD